MGWVVNVKAWLLYPHGRRPGAHRRGDSVWTGAENVASTGIRSLDRPARSKSLYQLRYPGTTELFYNECTMYSDCDD